MREIVTPHHAPAPFTLAVLVVVVAVKELLFRRVLTMADSVGSSAVRTEAWHHRADAITSGAAFIGISIALLGGPGYEPADDWAALFACVLIAYNGYRLLIPSLNEMMDVAPSPIIDKARSHSGVERAWRRRDRSVPRAQDGARITGWISTWKWTAG